MSQKNGRSLAQVLDLMPMITPFLSIEDLVTVLSTSKGALRALSEQGTYEMLRARFFNAEIEDFVMGDNLTNGLSLIRGLSTFYRIYEKALCSIGSSKGLRIDTIFENAEFFEKVCDETEIFNFVLEKKKREIVSPEFCQIVVKNYCRRGEQEATDILSGECEIEPLQITLHEYRWGAHNPIGFRARDVEIISTFFLKQGAACPSTGHFIRYTSCGESDFYEKLDALRKKARNSSLMECLTPSVVWIGGQRRADVARGRGLSV